MNLSHASSLAASYPHITGGKRVNSNYLDASYLELLDLLLLVSVTRVRRISARSVTRVRRNVSKVRTRAVENYLGQWQCHQSPNLKFVT